MRVAHGRTHTWGELSVSCRRQPDPLAYSGGLCIVKQAAELPNPPMHVALLGSSGTSTAIDAQASSIGEPGPARVLRGSRIAEGCASQDVRLTPGGSG